MVIIKILCERKERLTKIRIRNIYFQLINKNIQISKHEKKIREEKENFFMKLNVTC